MTRNEFIRELRNALSHLRREDQDKTISYYSEMIADRIDSGMSEEDAVRKMGSIDLIVKNVEEEIGTEIKYEEKQTKKSNRGILTVLFILAIPLWVPIFASIFSFMIAIYATLWALIASFIAIEVAFAISGVGTLVLFAANLTTNAPTAFLMLGASMILFGLCILFYRPMTSLLKKTMYYSKRSVIWFCNKVGKLFKEI